MASDEVKIALIEKELLRLATEIGMIKVDQSKTNDWINDHKMEEINRHNMVMNAIQSVSNSIEENKRKGSGRLALFDRMLVSITALTGLVVFLVWLYNQIKGTPVNP
jgi:hypothetical protein